MGVFQAILGIGIFAGPMLVGTLSTAAGLYWGFMLVGALALFSAIASYFVLEPD